MSKRVLHISNKPIFPLVDGGCVAINQFCQSMFQIPDWSVFHLCISTKKHPFHLNEYTHSNQQFKQFDHVFMNTAFNFKTAVQQTIKGNSYNLTRFQSNLLINKIESWIAQHQIDVLIFDSLYAAAITEIHSFKIPFYIRAHNIESEIWNQKGKNNPMTKLVYKYIANRIETAEQFIFSKSNGVFFISNDDEKFNFSKNKEINTTVIPVGVSVINNLTKYHSNRFHFIGAMNWHPNQEALELLLKSIFPLIKQKNPDAELHLAGSYFPTHIQTNIESGIYVHGFVNDATAFRRAHGTQIMPIQSGSGVRIKLIEALAEGIPVVATLPAVLGMDPEITNCCLIRDSNQEIANAALELNQNTEIRDQLINNGYSFVENHFSIDSIALKIAAFVRD